MLESLDGAGLRRRPARWPNSTSTTETGRSPCRDESRQPRQAGTTVAFVQRSNAAISPTSLLTSLLTMCSDMAWSQQSSVKCRQVHLPHGHCTVQTTCVRAQDELCAMKLSSTRRVSPCASRYTEHQQKFSPTYFSCVTVVFFSETRPVVLVSTCAL